MKKRRMDSNLINFKDSGVYTGKETIAEVLLIEGCTEELLTEGIFSMPIEKVKSIFLNIKKNVGDVEYLKNISEKYGHYADKIDKSAMMNKLYEMAESKGIEETEIKSIWKKILRSIGVFAFFKDLAVLFPITFIIIGVAIVTCSDRKEFYRKIREYLSELSLAVRNTSTPFEEGMQIIEVASTLVLLCFIPPFIQFVALAPIFSILFFVAFVQFIVVLFKKLKE